MLWLIEQHLVKYVKVTKNVFARFPDDPEEEFKRQAEMVLRKLGLEELVPHLGDVSGMGHGLSAESESGAKPNQEISGDMEIEKIPNDSSQLGSPPIGDSSSTMDPSDSPLNRFDKRLHRNINNSQLSILDTHENQTTNASSNLVITQGFTSAVAHEQAVFEASGGSTTKTSTTSSLTKDQVSPVLSACGNGAVNSTRSNESGVTATVNKDDSLTPNKKQTLVKPLNSQQADFLSRKTSTSIFVTEELNDEDLEFDFPSNIFSAEKSENRGCLDASFSSLRGPMIGNVRLNSAVAAEPPKKKSRS